MTNSLDGVHVPGEPRPEVALVGPVGAPGDNETSVGLGERAKRALELLVELKEPDLTYWQRRWQGLDPLRLPAAGVVGMWPLADVRALEAALVHEVVLDVGLAEVATNGGIQLSLEVGDDG